MKPQEKRGMTSIVKASTKLTVGLVLLFGFYIIMHGHLAPGGGFAGGVIVALALVQTIIAFGKDTKVSRISRNLASNLESVGAVMFLLIAITGFLGGAFFMNLFRKGTPFELFSAGTIPISNIAIGLKVGVGLFTIFLALVILEKASKEDKE